MRRGQTGDIFSWIREFLGNSAVTIGPWSHFGPKTGEGSYRHSLINAPACRLARHLDSVSEKNCTVSGLRCDVCSQPKRRRTHLRIRELAIAGRGCPTASPEGFWGLPVGEQRPWRVFPLSSPCSRFSVKGVAPKRIDIL